MNILDSIVEKINDNQIEEALELIEKNSCEFQDNVDFWNIKGVLCIKAGEFYTAIDCLKKAVELDGDNVDVLYNLAYAYEKVGILYNAVEVYRKILTFALDTEVTEEVCSNIKRLEEVISSNSYQTIIRNTDNKAVPKPGDDIYYARTSFINSVLEEEAPLVSIYVQAYNNLEKYTRTCVECILRYTEGIDYELVLVDNGSSDGTFEYFKTIIHPKKKIIRVTKNIGSGYGGIEGFSATKGRYIVAIPNDLYVTKDWLSNLLKCAMSDNRIGMVVPTSDYVSNFQSVNLEYTDFYDMQQKAATHNVSDCRKWEERIRLITLVTLYKRECLDVIGFFDYGFFHDFSDDDMSFRVRRAGYKTVLCKDTFVSHAGKITDKGEAVAKQSIEKGKTTFKRKYYGVDAWDDVSNYEVTMMSMLEPEEKRGFAVPQILGIDVLCGTPILEIKNKLRKADIYDAKLSAFSSDAKYYIDLKTICEEKVYVDRPEYILESFEDEKFDYIIFGKSINSYKDPYKLLGDVLTLLKPDGELYIKFDNMFDVKALLNIIGYMVTNDCERRHHILLEDMNNYLIKKGYFSKSIKAEFYDANEGLMNILKNTIRSVESVESKEDILKKMMVKDYIIKVVKQK